jgi:transcriptional regulator with XRE-family HTH domain
VVNLRKVSVDPALVIKQRLQKSGLEQRDLASAAQVTESYVSQLLSGKKTPPAPSRTDIDGKMGNLLRIPGAEHAKLAEFQRKEGPKKTIGDRPEPLFKQVRELTLRKCAPEKEKQIHAIFEKQPFGELEHLITQKLLDVVKRIAKREFEDENWLRLVARLSDRSEVSACADLLVAAPRKLAGLTSSSGNAKARRRGRKSQAASCHRSRDRP